MSKNHVSIFRLVILALTVILIFTLVQSPRATQAAPLTARTPMLAVQVVDVTCDIALFNVNTTYKKVDDIGYFEVKSSDSIVELTFNGRIFIGSTDSGSSGAIFELRVDDTASVVGRSRATVRADEFGGSGVPVSITGLFPGLSSDSHHMASMWVRTNSNTAYSAKLDPGCWASDVLIVKEHLPFGFVYMPLINK